MIKPPKFNMVFAAHRDAAEVAEYARVVWAETVAELELYGALDVSQKSRLATIERYCRFRAEFQFLYPVCMSDGPVKQGPNGDYVNLRYSAVQRLDEKLAKYDDLFWRWCGGKTPEAAKPVEPTTADKYLARSVRH